MFKLIAKSLDGSHLNEIQKESKQECIEWAISCNLLSIIEELVSSAITEQVEIQPAVIESQELLDENGEAFNPPQFQNVEISPAQYEIQEIQPAVYRIVEQPNNCVITIEDISAKLEQEKINEEALALLASTDFKVLRHIRQKALGQELSLSEEEYLALEQQRSDAAAKIVR